MKSPFPGMDPYLERHWEDMHQTLAGWKRNRRELYPMPLRERLPILPIFLRQNESPVLLDIQALVDQAYATGRYDRLDYCAQLDPPLSADDTAWAEALLKAAGKR